MNEKESRYLSDQEILENYYASHNQRLLGVLLQRYTFLLLGVCMKYLKNEEAAKDATQQVFLKVIAELQRYRVQYFKSWLYMIAKNYCLMQLRNHGNKPIKALTDDLATYDEPHLQYHKEKEKKYPPFHFSISQIGKSRTRVFNIWLLGSLITQY